MMFPIKTLQQRFVVYMLLPVALLLAIMGAIGFLYARNTLIQQWEEAAALKLQRAAHHVDMRLTRPRNGSNFISIFVEGHHYSMQRRQEVLRGVGTYGRGGRGPYQIACGEDRRELADRS